MRDAGTSSANAWGADAVRESPRSQWRGREDGLLTDRVGARLERVLEFEDGEQIVADGTGGTDMYVVLSGGVRVSKVVSGRRRTLAELQRGAFFGEMSLLESLPRDADAHAVGTTRVLAIGQGGLLARLRRDPSFALELLHQMSGRIRALNERLSVLEGDPPR